MARAARIILKALRINLLLRRAIRSRIAIEANSAAALIARKVRVLVTRWRGRNLRRRGYFYATIYLECSATGHSSHDRLQPHHRVELFGEFSEEAPWQVRKLCRYDGQAQCFKVDVLIKTGHLFKFVVDNGRHYCHSERYATRGDDQGNCNNVFEPKEIKWIYGERKKQRKPVMPPQQPITTALRHGHVIPIQRPENMAGYARYQPGPPSPMSAAKVERLSPNAMSQLPDYLGFDNLRGSSDDRKGFPLKRVVVGQRDQPSPVTAVHEHVPITTAPFSIPSMPAPSGNAPPPMPEQLPIH